MIFEVSKLVKSIDFNDEHPENNSCKFSNEDESRWEKSIETIFSLFMS